MKPVIVFPPGPKRGFAGSALLRFRKDPLTYLERMARDFGDISYVKLGRENIFLLNHPDLVRDVLVTNYRNFSKGRAFARTRVLLGEGLLTSEGDFHRRQRRMIQPAFHPQRIATFAAAMTRNAERTGARWRNGERLEVVHEMRRLTLEIVGETLFGTDLTSDASEVGTALAATMESLSAMMLLPLGKMLERLPLPPVRRMNACRNKLDKIVYRLINDRRRSAQKHGDLLQMLLDSQDEEDSTARMTDTQVRDEAMTIALAGQLTTASALSWTWYLLSQHREVENQLHEEVDRVLNGRGAVLADIGALKYTENIIRESLRLYPPAWMTARRALSDYQIGSYVAPAKSIVIVSQYLMHRDARYFPEPLRFCPERWTPEFRAALPKYAYFPFGGGLRGCIGEGFAWMEMILILATLAQRWKLRLDPGQLAIPQPLVTLQPKHSLTMTVVQRREQTCTS